MAVKHNFLKISSEICIVEVLLGIEISLKILFSYIFNFSLHIFIYFMHMWA